MDKIREIIKNTQGIDLTKQYLDRVMTEIQPHLDQFEQHIKEECAKEADSAPNPYPESVFPMDTEGYVKAIPDEHLRTAISGYCGRMFFDIAKQEIAKTIRED